MAKKKSAPKAKESKKAVMGGEAGGASNGTARDPATTTAQPGVDGEAGGAQTATPPVVAAGSANTYGGDAEKDASVKAAAVKVVKDAVEKVLAKSAEKAVDEAFATHPMDVLHVTSDGQVFGNENHAVNHARTLDNKVITTVDRKSWGK